MTGSNGRLTDWLLTLWILAAGVAFVVTPMELWPAGRYVYTVVLAGCVVVLALRVLDRVGKRG